MLFSYHLLYFCTALSLIIMLSSHYHHHKSKTFSQLTQCPFTGTLLLFKICCSATFSIAAPQCIQNSAARIVSNTSRYTSITSVLKKLHWLPVEQRTVFKTSTLVYKYLHTGFPRYFAPYLSSYSSSYITRHSQSGGNFLVFPFCS